jgi:hypothetical protein
VIFRIQTQQQDQWCWAAVSSSISSYYSASSTWSQCEVASHVLQRRCCGNPGRHNVAARLQHALGVVGRLKGIVRGSLAFDDIRTELLRGNPIAARIEWRDGGGHFVIIRGCHERSGVQFLSIADPFFPDSIQRYERFVRSYRGAGQWSDTFLVGL